MIKTNSNLTSHPTISKFDVMCAFFRTEEEENENMAKELNKILNKFCQAEREQKKNVSFLPIDSLCDNKVIEYINQSLAVIFE